MLTVRTYQEGDIPALVGLINAADAVDRQERATTIPELTERFRWPGFRPTEDIFLWEEDDRLVAYGFLRLGEGAETCEFYTYNTVHPNWRGRGIGRQVLERIIERCVERRRAEVTAPTVYVRATCGPDESERVALYESLGMTPARYFIQMVYEHVQGELPLLVVPAGIEFRPYQRGVDDRAVWAADVEAFQDHWGFHGITFEEFEHWAHRPALRPDLSVVAWAGDEVAGLLLNEVHEDKTALTGRREGVLEALAVRKLFRRRGLGTALLVRGLQLMQQAGVETASLGTDSENLTGAVRIYERLGFRVRQRIALYRLDISNYDD
ncbi:MAG: GNAT family N-acetyltransferase [Chloroflexi bacterium]|nr:GNAT family N-acetyltransferase [Chloroflexota bacterium]MBU1748555.1 GNAT family N-acetyltransferase [Chloroflexota bacterium]MBU1879879.1 GNAT family N-acetyltransferase [Chloroflexota bacterium]